MPVYKMATGMQEDPIHPGTVFPKQKRGTKMLDQSPKVRKKLNLEKWSDESEGAEKKHRSTKMKTDQKSTKQKISEDDGKIKHSNKLKLSENSDNASAPDNQAQLSEKSGHKNKLSLSKNSLSKKHKIHSDSENKNTKTSTSFQKLVRVQKKPVQLRVAQMFLKIKKT